MNNNNQRDRIKITFFIPSLDIGGAERFLLNLLKHIDKEKFKVALLLGKQKGGFVEKIPKDIKIDDLNLLHTRYFLFRVIRYLKKEKPDIFFSFFSHSNLICILANLLCGKKTKKVISERTTYSLVPATSRNFFRKIITRFFIPFLMKILYPKADAIVCVSEGVAEDLKQIVKKPLKTVVIYNPVDIDSIIKLSQEPLNTEIFQKDCFNILSVGRLVKAKDYPTLIRAFKIVHSQVKSKLFILGEGEEKENMIKLIKKLSLENSVIFLNFDMNPYKYMARADLFVLSSIREGFPNVLIEAMTCGVPVISTNCKSGPNEIIKNGKNGFLVPVGNEKILANTILKLLKDKKLREEFSLEGKKTIQRFSIEKIIKQYENVFIKLANPKNVM